jgi:hypothetical protein
VVTGNFYAAANLMLCRVESSSGFRLHERPRRFTWSQTWLEIDQIMEQWVTPAALCFKVRVDKQVYHLEYQQVRDVWDVELIRST